jgi:hypothetical protein
MPGGSESYGPIRDEKLPVWLSNIDNFRLQRAVPVPVWFLVDFVRAGPTKNKQQQPKQGKNEHYRTRWMPMVKNATPPPSVTDGLE